MPMIEISHQAAMGPAKFIVLFDMEHVSSHDNSACDRELQLHDNRALGMTRTTVQSDTVPDLESVCVEGLPV